MPVIFHFCVRCVALILPPLFSAILFRTCAFFFSFFFVLRAVVDVVVVVLMLQIAWRDMTPSETPTSRTMPQVRCG